VTTAVSLARDAKPPLLLVQMMNPLMRCLLRTPLGRAVRSFALLEFTGRLTGRRFLVPVGWHSIAAGEAVFTPAPWRTNFAGGLPVIVHHRGRRRQLIGTLDTDPGRVAIAMESLMDERCSLRPIGVDVPSGHRLNEADVLAVDRAVITFTDDPSRPSRSA
jgi:hypothetical protein